MATFFVSQAGLDAGITPSDSNNGTSASTPWLTVNKVNSSTYSAGDIIQFRKGGLWRGTSLSPNRNGSAGNLLTFTAYGASGNKPIISGFSLISSGWAATDPTNLPGVYQIAVPNSPARVGEVTLDGIHRDMVKYPKGNTGYMRVTSGDTGNIGATGTIGNNANSTQMPTMLSSAPNCVGGEVVWRPRHWVLWRGDILTQTATQVTFTPFPATSGGSVYGAASSSSGFGFFLQNHRNLLTTGLGVQLGDWAYDHNSHILYMYFGGAGPSGHNVEVSTITDLVTIGSHTFLKFDNLDLQGANNAIVNMNGAADNTFNACNLFGAGVYGILGNGTTPRITVTNCTTDRIHSNVLRSVNSGGNAWVVTDNVFMNNAATAGMGGSGEGQYFAIRDMQDGSQILRNRIINTGYVGIAFRGTNTLIQNNYLDTYCTCKDDGAAIYTGGLNVSGSIIEHNICINGIGVTQGTPDTSDPRAHGIYMDDGANHCEIRFNTCAFNGNSGINLHSSFNINMHHNTCYDNHQSATKLYNGAPSTDLMGSLTLSNNIMFAKTTSERMMESCCGGSTTEPSWFTAADFNFWTRPLSEGSMFLGMGGTNRTLAQWKTFIGKEANSKAAPVIAGLTAADIRFEYNDTNSVKNVSLSGTYMKLNEDTTTTLFTGNIALQPFTSAILLKTAGGPPPTAKPYTQGIIIV